MSSIPLSSVNWDQNYHDDKLKGCVVRLSEHFKTYAVRYATARSKIEFYGTATSAVYYEVMPFRDRAIL